MKISIRFFSNREVRAIWDEENSKWYFHVIDIVSILNEQNDYTKANNYWRWLKRKLKQENPQLVSATHGFKFRAAYYNSFATTENTEGTENEFDF